MRRLLLIKAVLALCFGGMPPSFATNVEREQRWVEQTADSVFDGEVLFLNADGHAFYSIYTEAEPVSKRGMIVLHGTGFHPDWEQVVQPIRVQMTQHGWNTLSIQLPLLEKDVAYEDYLPLYPEVPPRLEAATDFLIDQGMETMVIVAHSQGATMASYYLSRFDHQIDALVAIGMSAQHVQPHINSAESLKKIDIPVLDLYGSKDFASVLMTARQRQNAGAHNPDYSQLVIRNAYHFFDDHEAELLDAVVVWLDSRFD
jgi:pimeloyl-ACP methyl ester carboxylesterase